MDYLGSMYIDNEMNLEEKRQFIEQVRCDRAFYAQTLELLEQEALLRTLPVPRETAFANAWRPTIRTVLGSLFKPLGLAALGFSAAALLFLGVFQSPAPAPCTNRFVLFEPAAHQVELTGSFTDWQRVAMQRVGHSGYWELRLPVPSGEHRFAYILDGERRIADPTMPASEKDDFGGENSILSMEAAI